ncbi:four helix bundle protein [Patescibacteria group bacterium]|nr:four helix bundle protein [Patescibacteria group bacterium]MBU4347482.1 four helix bundle protein [Patescibacteria group bacterium]MBU4455631.1 four helix bundle protein [Patescibacteria group bacterium]MCG2690895.1 four helix bundle protein [Candidatus Parcubacteria bacterium]
MLQDSSNKTNSNNYDLEERTAKFSEDVISFIKSVKRDALNDSILRQLIRSATSVGANYCEANNASSKSDFRNKIYICKKEINETKYWLRMLTNTNSELKNQARKLWQEAQELNLIFQKIVNSLNKKKQ